MKHPARIYKRADASAEYEVPTEADVLSWHKRAGDRVEKGEALCDLEAEKGVFSLVAPAAGTIADVAYREGEVWRRGAAETEGTTTYYNPPLCFIETEAAGVSPQPEHQDAARAPSKPRVSYRDFRAELDASRRVRESGAVRAVPAARTLARERGIDLASIRGSGPAGEITASDVSERHTAPEQHAEEARYGIPRLWRTIADHMTAGAAIPTAAGTMRFDAVPLLDLQRKFAPVFPEALWFPAYAAAIRVLGREEFALCNGYWDDGDRDHPVVLRRQVHIGISYGAARNLAVRISDGKIDGERLRILVLRDAAGLPLAELYEKTAAIIAAARAGALPLEATSGWTCIFNNIGALGHEHGVSILAGKVAATINFGAIDLKAGSGTLQLAFDHRMLDGAHAAAFMRSILEEMQESVIPAFGAIFRHRGR